MNLVDSSGWLEYLTNGKNAKYFAKAIEDTEKLLVSTINIYEIYKKLLVEKGENIALEIVALMNQAVVIDVTSLIAMHAAKISYEKKIPMADSIIYATAINYNATVWTQDKDFEGLNNVKYFPKK